MIQLQDAGEGKIPMLKINSDPVAWDHMAEELTEIYQRRLAKVAFLKSDAEIDFQYVADALDIAHAAGADRIGLMDGDGVRTKEMGVGEPRR